MNNKKYTALYCRISREDDTTDFSSSIETQKKYLKQYAMQNHMFNIKYYVDDGYSGTNFERSGFKQLLEDVEKNQVENVITKDLSRLGRNYLTTGYYIEHYFPGNSVRFIAINDQVDTNNQQNDLMPFRNIMNEWYARDISKKIKTAYRTKAINGEFTGPYPPYGYDKDPRNKNKLIPNQVQSEIVKRIFTMYTQGYSVYRICRYLKENEIPTPRADTYIKYKKYHTPNIEKYPFDWAGRTILTILNNEEYIGKIVCNKHSTKSYKDKSIKSLPKSEWIITNKTHEPIIDIDTFQKAYEIMASRMKRKVIKNQHLFIGKIRCGNCERTLTYSIDKRRNNRGVYVCGTYRVYGRARCTSHYIKYDEICEYVFDAIKSLVNKAKYNKQSFCNMVFENISSNFRGVKDLETNIQRDENRLKEIATIFNKLYEDYALNIIRIEDYESLKFNFEVEKENICNRIEKFKATNSQMDKLRGNTENFVNDLQKIKLGSALTKDVIDLLVDNVVIGEKKSNSNTRTISIFYKNIGILL